MGWDAQADGSTLLHIACSNGFDEVVEILALNGASFNLTQNSGVPVLHAAVWTEKTTFIKKLVGFGAWVEMRNTVVCSPRASLVPYSLGWDLKHDKQLFCAHAK
jgi:hypothetical protein